MQKQGTGTYYCKLEVRTSIHQIYIKALADAHKREMSQYIGHLENINPAKSFVKVSPEN